MNIAVVGLGIIGGSFCKAIKKHTDHRVIGINRTKSTAEKALKEGAIDEIGTHESLENADLIILSMYPQAVVDYVARYGEYIKKGAVVTDVSGIKRAICPQMTELSEKFGFVLPAVIRWQARKQTVLMFRTPTFTKMQATLSFRARLITAL